MWAQVINAVLGIWLMAAPAVLGYGDPAQINDRIIGPVAATFAIISWWEATRGVRWVNLVLGIWLIVVPWLLSYDSLAAIINSLVTGILLAGFATVEGTIKQRYGGGWAALWKSGTNP